MVNKKTGFLYVYDYPGNWKVGRTRDMSKRDKAYETGNVNMQLVRREESDQVVILEGYVHDLAAGWRERRAEAAVKVVGKKDPNELCSYEDVNGDIIDDLVCKYVTSDIAADFGLSTTSATVNGELLDATPFEGTDSVNIVKDCN